VTHDVVVLGSGAAGLVAAIAAADAGAEVGFYEKASHLGGTTAVSGGVVWIAANPHARELGIADTVEEGVTYLMSLSNGLADEALVWTFVENGPGLVEWIERVTPLRLQVIEGYPDYQPEHPGGKPGGGRSLEGALFPFPQLGSWADRVVVPARPVNIQSREMPMGGGSGIIAPEILAGRRERDERGIGQGIVGALLAGCLAHGIEPVTDARALDLVLEDGRVTGVQIEVDGVAQLVTARRGVVLATGGFERDAEFVRSFLRGPMTAPTGVETNTGDGLRMAMRHGVSLGNMREAWWVPVMYAPDGRRENGPLLVNRERTLPRSIMVNRAGVRFVNEASNYNAQGGAFHVFEAGSFDYPNLPSWLIFDHEYLRRYGVGLQPPTAEAPAWVETAPTLAGLAEQLGIDPVALAATVAEFNADVAGGRDRKFRRGDSIYDLWAGDRSHEGRRRTLGPIDLPPFHAVRIHPGCLGTSGGPRTDTRARVLDVDGDPIRGLYGAGNVIAGVTGMAYGGAGGTLGPAMVFGQLAGRGAAAEVTRT
jgi:3-oxosteroid 1-dehydrogenase